MRAAVVLICAALCMCAVAAADEVRQAHVTYPPARVLGVTEGSLVFQMDSRQVRLPMSSVESINLTGQTAYNEAEKFMAAGEYAAAAKAFDALAGRAVDRVQQIAAWRAVTAHEKAGRIGQATARWAALFRKSPVVAVLAQRPTAAAAKGSSENAEAIGLLEALLDEFKADAGLAEPLRSGLADLYTAEGETEKALALLNRITATQKAAPPAAAGAPAAGAASVSLAGAQYRRAALLMEQGKAADALAAVQEHLRQFREDELAAVLLLSGKARLRLAEAEGDPAKARELLLLAGLDFMRTYSYWPGSGEAPEALVAAGDVCAALGNPKAAQLAFETVTERYKGTPWAARAMEKLSAMRERGAS